MPSLMSSETAINVNRNAGGAQDALADRLAPHSRWNSLTGIQFLATGSYVPSETVSNDDLAHLGYDSDWIIQRTGIQSRRRLPESLATSDMAVQAARCCLDQVGADRADVDLVIVATMTPDCPVPSTACLVQQQLGMTAPAMDINAACAGFMYALTTGAQFVKTGACRQVLVIGADTNTRIVNPADHKTFPLFGDGAGAVLLGRGREEQGFVAYTLGADGEGAELLGVPGGGSQLPLTPERLAEGKQYIHMDGRSVFKWAVRLLIDSIRDALRHAELEITDLRHVIMHQANIRIMEAAAEDLGIPRERLLVNLDRYGNTSAGSIPLGLDEASRAGCIQRGDHLLLCGFGAGLAWGTAVVRW
jgi:3-oxoacyl-[acyl-carrier-protein] synthase-3